MHALQDGESAIYHASDYEDEDSDTSKRECVEILLKYGAQVDLPVRYDAQKCRMYRNKPVFLAIDPLSKSYACTMHVHNIPIIK